MVRSHGPRGIWLLMLNKALSAIPYHTLSPPPHLSNLVWPSFISFHPPPPQIFSCRSFSMLPTPVSKLPYVQKYARTCSQSRQELSYNDFFEESSVGKKCCGSASLGSICFWAFRIWIHWSEILIRIRILLSSSKNSKKNIDSYCVVTSLWLFIFEKRCKCTFKK